MKMAWAHTMAYRAMIAITIAEKLGGIYSLASIFRIIPRFLRDGVYDCIARNRHRLIKNSCAILTPEQQKKFID